MLSCCSAKRALHNCFSFASISATCGAVSTTTGIFRTDFTPLASTSSNGLATKGQVDHLRHLNHRYKAFSNGLSWNCFLLFPPNTHSQGADWQKIKLSTWQQNAQPADHIPWYVHKAWFQHIEMLHLFQNRHYLTSTTILHKVNAMIALASHSEDLFPDPDDIRHGGDWLWWVVHWTMSRSRWRWSRWH